MSDGTSAPVPEGEPTVLQVQLTLAQAQLAMAQALLALSGGRSICLPAPSSLSADGRAFKLSGKLDICAGELVFVDAAGPTVTLESLADEGKAIQLEFDLFTEAFASGSRDTSLFTELAAFLQRRASTVVLMKSTCLSKPPRPPAEAPVPQGPSPTVPPDPTPAPAPGQG